MLPRYICLNASEVAALAGRHRYQPREESLERLAQRLAIRPRSSEPEELPQERGDRLLQELRAACPSVDAKMRASVNATTGSDARVFADAVTAEIMEMAAASLSAADVSLVKERCRSEVYCRYGAHSESAVTDALRSDACSIVKDDVYRKRLWFELEDATAEGKRKTWVFVGGKCDGIMTLRAAVAGGEQRVVEIKNRVNRLFGLVPEYEKVQVHCYMHIYGLDHASLIENHDGRTAQHDMTMDAEYWAGLTEDVRAAIEDLRRSVTQTQERSNALKDLRTGPLAASDRR